MMVQVQRAILIFSSLMIDICRTVKVLK